MQHKYQGKTSRKPLKQFTLQRKVLTASAILMIAIGCKTLYAFTTPSYTAANNESSIERGKNLTYNVCGQCHYDYKDTKQFTGMLMKDLPAFMGTVYSADLTDKAILSSYTDEELAHLLKTGLTNRGKFIPYMIRPTMADRDLYDIIAYLRSGDEPVRSGIPVTNKTKLSGMGKLAVKFGGKPTPDNRGILGPDEDEPVVYGRYLVDIIGCYHCHSASILSLNYTEPEKSKGYMAGGMKWNMDGEKVYASNLTPCVKTGIGTYTKEDFRKAVQEKIAPGGRKLKSPMHKYPNLTDKQTDAIYTYLMTLPKQNHEIKGHTVNN